MAAERPPRLRIELGSTLVIAVITVALALRYFPGTYPSLAASTHWVMAVAASLALVGSVIAHELAHGSVARLYGVRTHGITLMLSGGRANVAGVMPTPTAEIVMSMAGPLMNLALAGAGAAALSAAGMRWGEGTAGVIGFVAYANLLLAAVNAMPIFPLDGGRIIRALLWRATRSLHEATRLAATLGVVVAAATALVGLILLMRAPVPGMLAAVAGVYFLLRAYAALRASRGA